MPYMWHPQRKHTNEHIYKTETDSQICRVKLCLLQGIKVGGWEAASLEHWRRHVHMALFKMNDQQGPRVEHGERCLSSCGRLVLWREAAHIWMAEALYSPGGMSTTMSIGNSPTQNKSGNKLLQLRITSQLPG